MCFACDHSVCFPKQNNNAGGLDYSKVQRQSFSVCDGRGKDAGYPQQTVCHLPMWQRPGSLGKGRTQSALFYARLHAQCRNAAGSARPPAQLVETTLSQQALKGEMCPFLFSPS